MKNLFATPTKLKRVQTEKNVVETEAVNLQSLQTRSSTVSTSRSVDDTPTRSSIDNFLAKLVAILLQVSKYLSKMRHQETCGARVFTLNDRISN